MCVMRGAHKLTRSRHASFTACPCHQPPLFVFLSELNANHFRGWINHSISEGFSFVWPVRTVPRGISSAVTSLTLFNNTRRPALFLSALTFKRWPLVNFAARNFAARNYKSQRKCFDSLCQSCKKNKKKQFYLQFLQSVSGAIFLEVGNALPPSATRCGT